MIREATIVGLVDPHLGPPVEPPDRPVDPTCRDVIELLLDYVEDTLDPATRASLEHHFQDCAPCVAYLRTYDRSRRLVGDVMQDEAAAELPPNVKGRLRQLLLRRLGSARS
jgi:anti-sigma factor RsiW